MRTLHGGKITIFFPFFVGFQNTFDSTCIDKLIENGNGSEPFHKDYVKIKKLYGKINVSMYVLSHLII